MTIAADFRAPAARVSLVCAAFAASFLTDGCGRAQSARRGAAAVPVLVGQSSVRTLPITLQAIGTVQSIRTVVVKSQVDGAVAKINFREGDEVPAGSLLVTLDQRPFQNNLRSARADLANARAQAEHARAEAERYQRLDQQQAISKEQLAQLLTTAESTAAQVQAREAAVANAELQLSYTEIRAPIAGRTGQLALHEGALMKANDSGSALVTINQIAPISVAYAVPESDLAAVRAAIAAGSVAVTANPHDGTGESVQGTLDFIDNSVDATTGTILLKAVFANADRSLWPGQFVDITTRLGEEADAVVVPASAVQIGQNGTQVFVVRPDNTVDLRPVVTGLSVDSLTAIRSGVKAGETVVTDGQLRLVPGARVEIKTAGNPGERQATATASSGRKKSS